MNYGMWVAASGVMTNMAKQDVLSNNLANVSTVGFKADRLPIRQRDAARVEDNLPYLDSNAMLERLGAGVMPMATGTDFSQGPIRETGNALDVAIRGDGFFRVEDQRAGAGFALTRDGRLTINDRGVLTRASDGSPVLDPAGATITVDRSLPAEIDERGRVLQGGREVATLGLVDVSSRDLLHKAGTGSFRLNDGVGAEAVRASASILAPGSVEDSAVNPIGTLMGITSASRSAQSGLRLIGSLSELSAQAISRLGRVS